MLQIAGGILVAVAVLFVVFMILMGVSSSSGSSNYRSEKQRAKDYAQLVMDYRAGTVSLFGPCSEWEHMAARDEAFPEEAAKREARPRCFSGLSPAENAEAWRRFYERYPEEEERDRIANAKAREAGY
jgi:hypothetical protein